MYRLSSLNVKPPELFANLTADCHPIASKSCQYNFTDRKFIGKETKIFLKEGIIEKKAILHGELRWWLSKTHMSKVRKAWLLTTLKQSTDSPSSMHTHYLELKLWTKFLNFVSTVLLISKVPTIVFQSLLRLQVGSTSLQECLLESLTVWLVFKERWMSLFPRRSWKVLLPTWMMSQYAVWYKRNMMTIWRLSLKLQNGTI